MVVLSLFDGIATARVALERAGIKVTKYYASEIDIQAIKIAQKNYKDIIHLGDVRQINKETIPEQIDLLIGGSPCQDLSIANRNGQGLQGKRSKLFWEYVRIKNELKPKYFIFENVYGMKRKDKDIITNELQVEPIMIDAALVSAQSRKRLFWTNISVKELPKDKGIKLKDIIIDGYTTDDKAYCITANYYKMSLINYKKKKQGQMIYIGYIKRDGDRYNIINNDDKVSQALRVYSVEGKSVTLQANSGGLGGKTGLYLVEDKIRKLYPVECERLQGLPDNYTEGISTTQRYKCIGNAFNVDVIVHILQYIKGEQND